MSSDPSLSLADILALEDEARELMPGDTSTCSFSEGYVRQAVYACKTCDLSLTGQRGGFCFACSISCHSDHDLIELFPKRHFKCDCPTFTFPTHACSLQTPPSSASKLPPNTQNHYDHNFDGIFCICRAPYDAQEEAESMIQCLVCEDWFHESHLNLIPPPHPPPSTPPPFSADAPPPSTTAEDEPTGPPPVLSEDDYVHFICDACVVTNPVLLDHLGTPNFMSIVRPSSSSSDAMAWEVLGRAVEKTAKVEQLVAPADAAEPASSVLKKHPLDPDASSSSPFAKKIKLSSTGPISTTNICTLSSHPSHLASLITARQAAAASDHGFGTGRLDLFLSEDFREKWCRCEKHLPQLLLLPYLLDEEETWEPADEPPAPDVEALLLSSLSSLPRGQAIDVITGFKDLAAGLTRYLRRKTEEGGEGAVIGKRDVETFFEKWRRGERD